MTDATSVYRSGKEEVIFELLRSVSAWDVLRLTGYMVLHTRTESYDGLTYMRTSASCNTIDDLIVTSLLYGRLYSLAMRSENPKSPLFTAEQVIGAFESAVPKTERLKLKGEAAS